MMQPIFLGIYLAIILVVFIFISMFIMRISEFHQYSSYLPVVLKIYLVIIVCISLFGGFKILTGKSPHTPPVHKLDF